MQSEKETQWEQNLVDLSFLSEMWGVKHNGGLLLSSYSPWDSSASNPALPFLL